MKRIKAMNGYTIYEVTARDEKQGNGTAGEFAVFFSSDIREYGVANSDPEWDGVDSLEVAEELASGRDAVEFAEVKEELEQESTAVTYEMIEERLQERREHEAYTEIIEALKTLEAGELVAVWREYCGEVNGYDDEVFDMCEFDEVYSGYTPEEVARRCFYGHDEYNKESAFNPNRAWFYFDGYGNPVSVDYIGWNSYAGRFMGDCIDADELALWCASHDNGLYCDEIQEALDKVYRGE